MAGAFDEDRAKTIATHEIARANSLAAVEGYKAGAALGLKVMKYWLISPAKLGLDVCIECEANAAQGPIELD